MELPFKVKQYTQKYRCEWEKDDKYKGWLRPVEGDPFKAKCVLCNVQFTAKLWDITKHSHGKKHEEKIKLKSRNKRLPFKATQEHNERNLVREAEGVLSMFIAEHTAILSVDHLSELCTNIFSDSQGTKDLKLHRTKCTQIIVNVLAPHFKELLLNDIGDQKYSIILDESTDISVMKQLGLVIRYFSSRKNQIISAFFSLVSLEKSVHFTCKSFF